MYRKTFKLKQHTPIIHFQHDQTGATLRATEVKPKLDRFLFESFKEDTGFKNHWLSNPRNPSLKSLNYQLSFSAGNVQKESADDISGFFGNTGKPREEQKKLTSAERNEVTVSTFVAELGEYIEQILPTFFCTHNFGARQNRGFGSFTLSDPNLIAGDNGKSAPGFSFRVSVKDVAAGDAVNYLFERIDLFYRSVRSGINGIKLSDGGGFARDFYMKPLIFQYAMDSDIAWEKKWVKQNASANFFPHKSHGGQNLNQQYISNRGKVNRQDEWPLWYPDNENEQNFKIIKDIFGLSRSQSWVGYRNGVKPSVNKAHAPGHRESEIERVPSPWMFKPIRVGDEYLVEVYVSPSPDGYLGSSFEFDIDGHSPAEQLEVWDGFDMQDFIRRYLKKSRVENCIQPPRNGKIRPNEQHVKDALLVIYKTLKVTQ
jgi:hypothetical protein